MDNASQPTWLDLYDWRQQVADLYRARAADLAAGENPAAVCRGFRVAKDVLFVRHRQSPLGAEQRRPFRGLAYFPYDPALCVEALLIPEPAMDPVSLEAGGPHQMTFHRAARVRFQAGGADLELIVYWIDVYGGGLFLPFRDATGPAESYGGGRYLFDTVKGSDFLRLPAAPGGPPELIARGWAGGRVVLDFNYAYNPSCAYDARWVCPLAPPENRLPVAIRAGERKFHD